MSSKFYKRCGVPLCKNNSMKSPDKLFITVPLNVDVRRKWFKAANKAFAVVPKSHLYFCEDHFDLPNDMENYMEYKIMNSIKKIRMKSSCLPTKFECQVGRQKNKKRQRDSNAHLRVDMKRQRLKSLGECEIGSEEDTDLQIDEENFNLIKVLVPDVHSFDHVLSDKMMKIETSEFAEDQNKTRLRFHEYSDDVINDKLEDITHLECESDIPEFVNIRSEIGSFKLENEKLVIKQEDEIIDNCIASAEHDRFLAVQDETNDEEFACSICSYRGKRKDYLRKHWLKHHSHPLEVKLLKCNECDYQANDVTRLREHMLIHKDPSEVAIFKCLECDFQTKHNRSIRRHLDTHRDPSERTMFKCEYCDYQCKQMYVLKRHILIHKNPSEIEFLKCKECKFHTKHKEYLNRHVQKRHRNIS